MRRRSDDLPAFGSPTRAASARSLRRSSSSVSSPAGAGTGDYDASAGPGEIGDELALRVEDLCPCRHAELDLVAGRAVLVPALSRPAAGRPVRRLPAKGREIAQ